MHNNQDENGDTILHRRLRNCDISIRELRQCLLDGADVNIKNSHRRTLLLEAAKFSDLGIQVYKLLLMWYANVNVSDSENSTVLHDALKNPHVTIHMLMLFLQRGKNPHIKDSQGFPPHAYVMKSSLPDESKIHVSKLLILSCIVYSLNGFKEEYKMIDRYHSNRDVHINLDFYVGDVREELLEFRDRCIKEISLLYIDKFHLNCPIFDVIYRFCCTCERGDITLRGFRNHSRIEIMRNYVSLQAIEYFALRYGDLDSPFILLEYNSES